MFRTFTCPSSGEAIYEIKSFKKKLFASSWYIFLTYIYDARSHLYQKPNVVKKKYVHFLRTGGQLL